MAASPKSDGAQRKDPLMNWLLRQLGKYDSSREISIVTHGPLIFWMHAVFGIKGSTYVVGVSGSPRSKMPAGKPLFESSMDT
jgi:hypothetical protein